VQQPCSNADTGDGKLDVQRHREEIRRLVAEAPDEPTYCEFKEALSYGTPKENGELVKDVSSFANTDLEALGGHGYIIFGVSNGGRVVGTANNAGDPSSAVRQIVNGNLGRSVSFEYLTCEVDDKAGGTKPVAAIVIPDSRRRPHVAARAIKERLNGRDKFWLREGEIWVRKTGGRELATADDIDEMYESKLRRLVEERVRPLQQRVEALESDLREQRSLVPELNFGLAVPGNSEPSSEGSPYPVLGNLVRIDYVTDETAWARQRAREAATRIRGYGSGSISLGPDEDAYERYRERIEEWASELAGYLVIDFVLVNTGRTPAEDVEVVLAVPAELSPEEDLPEEPERPRSFLESSVTMPRFFPSKHGSPDSLIGPEIHEDDGGGQAAAVWEVGKLYHDRPLFTSSDLEEVGGLLISRKGYEYLARRAPGGVRLDYAVRAANVPETLRGSLVLKKVPA
jgi:hypothetical protein